MQNNERSNSGAFRKFFQEKGYYIVLFLCIAAVGISGYIFVRSAISEKNSLNDETLSVATTTTVPSAPESSKPIKPAAQAGGLRRHRRRGGPGRPDSGVKPDPDETVRAAAKLRARLAGFRHDAAGIQRGRAGLQPDDARLAHT